MTLQESKLNTLLAHMKRSAIKKLSSYKTPSYEFMVHGKKQNTSSTNHEPITNNHLVKIGQASQLLGISIDTLRRWEKKSWLRAVKTPGGTRLYDKEQLQKLNPLLKRGPKSLLSPLMQQPETLVPISNQPSLQPFSGINLSSDNSILKTTDSISSETLEENIEADPNEEFGFREGSALNEFQGSFSSIKSNLGTLALTFLLFLVLSLPIYLLSNYFKDNQTVSVMADKFNNNPVVQGSNLTRALASIFSPTLSQKLFGKNPPGAPPGNITHPPAGGLNGKTNPAQKRDSGYLRGDEASKLRSSAAGSVLAESSPSGSFLQINLNTEINGTASISGALNAPTLNTGFGDNELYPMDQPLLTTSTPSFSSLTLSGTSNQLTLANTIISTQLGGSGAFTASIPTLSANANFVMDTTSQTLTNKTISGSSNTFSNIPISALSSSTITISPGAGLSGGGSVSLGSSVTITSTLGTSIDLTSEVEGILPIANGGTNSVATPTAGAIAYGTGTAFAFNAAGTSGQVLTSAGAGTPTWTTVGAAICPTCVVTNPAATQTITPTSATATGLSIAQASLGSVDIFNVTNNGGGTTYFKVDSSGNTTINGSTSNTGTFSTTLGTTLASSSGNTTIGNATGTFALTSNGGLNVTTGGALTGVASIDTITTSSTALTFAAGGTVGATSTGLNLQADGAIDVNIAGGSGAGTGCTVTNTTGDLTCTGNITGSTSGTAGFWTRTSTTLSPATANDIVSISGNSGDILTLASSATGDSNKALNVSQTGATVGTDYGGYFSNTGAATTNVGLYTTASGATNNYALIAAAGNVGIGTTAPAGLLDVSKSLSGTPSTTGKYLSLSASTFTDNNTAASGTVANMAFNSIAAPTLAASNASVVTDHAATLYIGGAPTNGSNETITNPYALNIASGTSAFGGVINLTGASTTVVGTAVEGLWTLNSNTFTYKRGLTVTNNDGSNALPVNYEITVTISGSNASQIYSHTRGDQEDFRIAYNSTEIARNITTFTSSSIVFSFQLQAAIAASGSSTAYSIYYGNSTLASGASTYTGNVQIDSLDTTPTANWTSADTTQFPLADEATIKNEGSGSLKATATVDNIGTFSTTSQNALTAARTNFGFTSSSIGGTTYLYAIGGSSDGTAGNGQTTVYRTSVAAATGNVAAWSTNANSLSAAVVDNSLAVATPPFDTGTGSDGAIDLTNGGGAGGCTGTGLSWAGSTCTIATATKSTFNFTTVTIPVGTTLTTDGPKTTTNFVTIKATGAVTVAGTINLSGKGYQGGQSTQTPGTGSGGGACSSCFGGGGAGYGGAGGQGGGFSSRTAAGATYSTDDSGSGGAGGNSSGSIGGNGGGGIKISGGGTITVSGTINTSGTNGSQGGTSGGGGGSGGRVYIQGSDLTVSGTVSANGGNGNTGSTTNYGGGGGGGGRITFEYSGSLNTTGSTITVTKGTGGAGTFTGTASGTDGSNGASTNTASSPTLYVLGGKNTSGTTQSGISQATITASDGSVGAFSASSVSLPQALFGQTSNVVTIGTTNYLYILGGHNGTSDQTTVYKGTFSGSDISAIATTSQTQLGTGISYHATVTGSISATNYIWVLGGLNGSTAQTSVYRGTIDASGNITALSTTSQGALPQALYGHKALFVTVGSNNYIYVYGGMTTGGTRQTTVYKASVDGSGNVGSFTTVGQTQLSSAISDFGAFNFTDGSSNQYAYIVGGNTGTVQSAVLKTLYSPIDQTTYSASRTISSSNWTNKNSLTFQVYSSRTGSYMNLQFFDATGGWQTCTFSVSSANTWETKTCDISAVSSVNKDAVTQLKMAVSSSTTTAWTMYLDDINAKTNATTISNTASSGSSVLGAANLSLNAQGTGLVALNYDATNAAAGSGGLIVYNGGSTSLFTVGSDGSLTATGAISGLTGISSSGTINFSGLNASSAVYTDASKNLTSTAPTSGAIGYWTRTSTTLSPATANDIVSITSNSATAVLTLAPTGATGTGLAVSALSGATANTGVSVGAISGTGTGTGVSVGNISSTGTANVGLSLGTMTGGTSTNYQISTGVLTSATTTTNAQINLGGVVTTGGTTNYGINVGALSGTGTTNTALNVTAMTSTGTSTGIAVGAMSGAGTANTGISVGAVSGATTNNALTTAGGAVSFTDASNTVASLSLTNNTATTFGNGGNTAGVIDLQSTSLSTGNFMNVEVNGLTTGTGFNLSSTGTVASGGELMSLQATGITSGRILDITSNANTLTTGQLVNISSSATSTSGSTTTGSLLNVSETGVMTSTFVGNLAYLDWTPGSVPATFPSGDLFRIHIGPNGTTTGNLFNIVDDTSSVFSVSETTMTTSLPANFTSPGDVSIAYDLNFTNPTSSFIKSAAPLYVQAGDTPDAFDLTLRTFNAGTIVFDSGNTTGTGVDFTNSTITTGTGLNLALNGLTTGTGEAISSTSTAGGASGSSSLLTLTRSGANANATHTAYGLQSSVTNTGTTNTNVGGLFTATGATTNYAIQTGAVSTAGTANYGINIGAVTGATSNYEIAFAGTTPEVAVADGGTITISDGTNTLCTIADAGTTGNLSCTGTITGSGSGAVGYWTRTGTTLTPATANDIVSIPTTNTTGADLAITNTGVYTGTGIFNLTANSTTTGTLINVSGTGLTTGTALDVNATNTHNADVEIQQVRFDLINAQTTAANNNFNGLSINFSNQAAVDNNLEYAARVQNQVVGSFADTNTSTLLLLDNADTSAAGSTVVGSALRITNSGNIAGGIVNAINIDDTDITTDIVLQNDETIDNNTDNQINLGLGTSGTLLLTSTTTASITNSAGALAINAQATGLNLQADGAIDVNLAGGSGATGCTVANASGDLTCTGNITGSGSGTSGFWTRTSTTLSPATANDIVSIPTTNTTGADLAITNTGIYTGTGIFNLTANSATTGIIQNISGNGLTSGNAFSVNSSSTAFTGALGLFTLSGSNAANTGNVLEVANTGTANTGTSLYVKHYATGTNNLAMRVDDVSGDTTPFVIDGTGNVGIGTTDTTYDSSIGKVAIVGTKSVNAGLLYVVDDTAQTTGVGGGMFFAGKYTDAGAYAGAAKIVAEKTNSTTTDYGFDLAFYARSNGSTLANSRIMTLTGGKVGIGTTAPTNALSFTGQSAQTIWMERHTTADTAGNNLTVQAGGATSGATNKAGGSLYLVSGMSTGTGTSKVIQKVFNIGGSGTADQGGTAELALAFTAINTLGYQFGPANATSDTTITMAPRTSGGSTSTLSLLGGNAAFATAGTLIVGGGSGTPGGGNNNAGGPLTLQGGNSTGTAAGGDIIFKTADAGGVSGSSANTLTERARITPAGNFGYGTSSPDSLFDINLGTASAFQLTYNDADGTAATHTNFTLSSAGVLTGTATGTGSGFALANTQPASVGTTPGTAATSLLALSFAAGGDSSIATTGVGGVGSGIGWTLGTGGTAASATTASTGGAGGAYAVTGGTGGAASVVGTTNVGGAGGAISLTGGTGGAASGAGSNTGGAGGAFTILAGAAGSGGNSNGGTLTLNSGAVTGSGTSTLNLGSANATTVNLATATSATTLNIGAASTTAVTVAIAGGSADTGCTVNGATGDLTCTGNITGSGSGTSGFWSRTGTTLSPATANDIVSIANTTTTGSDLAVTNTGIYTGTGIFNLTANSTTTGNIAVLSGTGMTTGEILDITGTWAPADGSTNEGIDINITHTPTSSADNFQSINLSTSDGTALDNSVIGFQSSLSFSGNAAKVGQGIYSTLSTSSTTADTLIGADLDTSVSGIITTGTRNIYGIRSQPSAGAESTGGTTNVYGNYNKVAADVGAGGTVNGYGLYIANGTYDTDGTSTQYGIYVESPTGADTNYAAIFAGGNVGIGLTAPATLLEVAGTATFGTDATAKTVLVSRLAGGGLGNAMISAESGTLSNIDLYLTPKGTGEISLNRNNGRQAGGSGGVKIYDSGTTNVVMSIATTGNTAITSANASGTTTSSSLSVAANSLTTGTGIFTTSTSVTTGRLLDITTGAGNTWTGNSTTSGLVNIASASTAGTASDSDILLNITRSGANAQLAHTAYGVYSTVTNTNVTSGTNIAGYFSATGATTANYGLIVANGNVGIGTTAPAAQLDVLAVAASTGINLAGTAPVSVAGNGTSAATNTLLAVGTAGGASSGVTGQTGGTGGAISLTSGVGGAVAGASGIGGVGGGLTLAGGAGGAGAATGGVGGAISITAGAGGTGGNANGGTLTLNSGAITGSGTSTLNLGSSNATTVNLATSTSALAVNLGAASTTAVTVAIAGGSADTGCTVAGASGDLTCTGNITGSSSGTAGFWTRASTTLSPATSGDLVSFSDGTVSSPGIQFVSDSNTGIYRVGADNFAFAAGGLRMADISTSGIGLGNSGAASGTSNKTAYVYNTAAGATSGGVTVDESTTNMVANPSFEDGGLASWGGRYTGAGDAAASSSSTALFGKYSVQITAVAGQANGGALNNAGLNGLTTSTTYTYSVWVKGDPGSTDSVSLGVNSGCGNYTSAATPLTTSWQRLFITFNSGACTSFGSMQVYTAFTAGTNVYYLDGFQLEAKDHATSYADGSLGAGYAWTGTAHASSSTRAAGQFYADNAGFFAGGLGVNYFGTSSALNVIQGSTGSALSVTGNNVTTGNVGSIIANGLTTGNILSLTSTSTAAASNTQTGLNIALSGANGTSTQTTYGLQASNTHTGTSSTNVGGLFTATGGTTDIGVQVAAMTGATSTGLDIGNMSGATLNKGINIGTLGTATTSTGIAIGALSSATSNGITIGALSGTTADTGISIGAISGTGATGTGITVGNISTTGTTNYGLQLGTMTGGTTSNYQISTGVLTSATTTTNAQINLGGVVTTGGTTNYGINVGALSGTGTTNTALNVTAMTSTGTSTGIAVGAMSGAGTANTGISVGAVSGATTNNALTTAGGAVSFTDASNTVASLSLTNNTATTFGNGGNTAGVIDLQSTSLSTGNFMNVEVNGLTTGTGINLSSTGTIASGGELVSMQATGITSGRILDITSNANTLTTGQLVNISSSATSTSGSTTTGSLLNVSETGAMTSTFVGNLAYIDWTPGSAPATYPTGDILRLHIGPNASGFTGNIFNVVDDTSSVFSVSKTSVTTSLPANFTSPGDVSIAYDLNFTNPTSSFIKSAAPLYVQAGDTPDAYDLTLRTFNAGTIVFDSGNTTGTAIDFTNSTVTTGTGLNIALSGLTTGTAEAISSTSTAGGASGSSSLLTLTRSGANANASHTAYGIQSSVTNTGTTNTNIAGLFTATGATTNYAIQTGAVSTAGTANYGISIGAVTGATSNYEIAFAGTSPEIAVADGGTITISDGTNTLCTIADAGTTGNLTCSGTITSGTSQAFVQNGNSFGATAVLGTNDANELVFETGNVSQFKIGTTGHIALGNYNSNALALDDYTLGGGGTFSNVVTQQNTFTTFAGVNQGIYTAIELNPSGTVTNGNRGITNVSIIKSGNTQDFTDGNALIGADILTFNDSASGTVTGMQGVYTQTRNRGAGTVTSLYGLQLGTANTSTGTVTTQYAGDFSITNSNASGTIGTAYGLKVNYSNSGTITNEYGLDIGNLAGATLNTGINIGTLATATTSKGINIGALSSATSTGVQIGALSGATANKGLLIGNISGTGTGTGISIGTIGSTGAANSAIFLDTLTGGTLTNSQITTGQVTATGSTANAQLGLSGVTGTANSSSNFGILLGNIDVAGTTTTNYGMQIGNISNGTSNNYGIKIGTLTGGAGSSVYGIQTGTLTSVASGTNAQLDLGTIVDNTSSSSTNYGIRTGAISAAGTTNYGINVGAVSGATTNNALTTAQGAVSFTDNSNTAASLVLTNNTATTLGNGGNTLGVIDLQSTSLTTGNFMNIEVNALNSGKGINLTNTTTLSTGQMLNISSASTALTSGSLIAMDWTPGSAVTNTATGDLFKLTIGANGANNPLNFLNFYSGSSSVFSASQQAFTTSLPSNFTAAGDTSIAYDINFTNPTASYIKSAAPMYLTAGETFNSSNLVLSTYNFGTVLVDSTVTTSAAAATKYAFQINTGDTTTTGDTIYGAYITNALSGAAAKTGVGLYSTVTTSSTTSDTIIAADLATSATGVIGATTRNNYGLRTQPVSTSANTAGTQNIYGIYSAPSSTLAAGSAENVFGGYFKSTGTLASGTVNSYGVYIANPTMNTTGTSAKYGIYLEDLATTGPADANVGICFDCDNTYSSATAANGIQWGGGTETTTQILRLFRSNGAAAAQFTIEDGAGTDIANGSATDLSLNLSAADGTQGLCHDGADGSRGLQLIADCAADAADLAEYFGSDGTLEPGDVVVLNGDSTGYVNEKDKFLVKSFVKKSGSPYETTTVGIISTNPFRDVLGERTFTPEENKVPVALTGQVPVKVSTENGPIEKGDYLTSSSIPGVAMKATQAGQTIGKALKSYSGSGIGTTIVFVNVSYADPADALANLLIGQDGSLLGGELNASKITVSSDVKVGGLVSASIFTLDSSTLDLVGALASLQPNSENKVSVADALNAINNRVATNEELSASQIAEAKTLGEQAVAHSLTLDEKVASTSANISSLSNQISQLLSSWGDGNSSTPSGDLNLTPPQELIATDSATFATVDVTKNLSSASLDALDATISGSLKSLGDTFLGNTVIAGDFSVDGTLLLAGDSINSLACAVIPANAGIQANLTGSQVTPGMTNCGILMIQNSPLAQAVDFFNGLVTISKEGVLSAKTVVADQFKVKADTSAGTTIIPSGQIEIPVLNALTEGNSIIILTSETPGAPNLAVAEKVGGVGFVVKLNTAYINDVKFSYIIIGQKAASAQ